MIIINLPKPSPVIQRERKARPVNNNHRKLPSWWILFSAESDLQEDPTKFPCLDDKLQFCPVPNGDGTIVIQFTRVQSHFDSVLRPLSGEREPHSFLSFWSNRLES